MLKTEVHKGENIEKAIKRFKRKFNNVGVVKELRERKQFVKKSDKKRAGYKKAVYIQKIRDEEEKNY
jgi:small subunit ribosomal protein S21